MASSDSMSSDGSLSDRVISDAATSESGYSDDLGQTTEHVAQRKQIGITKSQLQAHAQAQAKQTSEYTKLALQEILHPSPGSPNYRASRRLEDLDAASQTSSEVAQKKAERMAEVEAQEDNPFVQARHPENDELAGAHSQQAQQGDGAANLAALAADRKVIQARLKELQRCSEWLKQLGVDIAGERTTSRESTHTAVEAVKRKFDVLRSVIDSKEKEFIFVVEEAGKARLDAATRGSCDCTIAQSELNGFITQLEVQLDRLEGNRKLFDESRRSMLQATQERTDKIESTIHKFQDDLDGIRSTSLGVHIKLDEQIEAIQKVQVPYSLTSRTADPPYVEAIPQQSFMTSPAAKVVRQTEEIPRKEKSVVGEDTASTDNGMTSPSPAAPNLVPGRESEREVHRKSFQQELADLRNSPMPRVSTPTRQNQRTNSPARGRAAAPIAGTREVLPTSNGAPAAGNPNSNIAKIAAKHQQRSSLYPPELEKLRAQVIATASRSNAAAAASSGTPRSAAAPLSKTPSNNSLPGYAAPTAASSQSAAPRRGGSPVVSSRTSSPLRTGIPMRTAVRADRRTNSPMRRVDSNASTNRLSTPTRNAAPTPGPGSYHIPSTFGSASRLSTPPRRR